MPSSDTPALAIIHDFVCVLEATEWLSSGFTLPLLSLTVSLLPLSSCLTVCVQHTPAVIYTGIHTSRHACTQWRACIYTHILMHAQMKNVIAPSAGKSPSGGVEFLQR